MKTIAESKMPTLAASVILFAYLFLTQAAGADPVPGGTLDPLSIPKYESPLVVPPAMPQSVPPAGNPSPLTYQSQSKNKNKPKPPTAAAFDYYQIAVRQFEQHILPVSMGLPETTVWSYGSVDYPGTVTEGGSFFYPALTIEARWNRPVRVKWINGLVDADGNYLPHLLPVDQTLHWANPPGPRDHHGMSQEPYQGPVPIIIHVHGAHVAEESDGYPEAWWLPAAKNIPAYIQYTTGSLYNQFKAQFEAKYNQQWEAGTAVFQYPNDQRATTLWYHDHTLGMTRLNVYAGPAGFYIIRGGPDDLRTDVLPGPALAQIYSKTLTPPMPDAPPAGAMNPLGLTYYEIPIVIQDRSFNADGSLWFPDNRAFFEELEPNQLQIPFIPDSACDGESDVSPIWNPEFFGNTIVVNGQTWPYLNVEPRRYRLRLLNGCNSRFLILRFDNGMPFHQIGSEGGFLPEPVELAQLLIGPAERADVIADFGDLDDGTEITLLNLGPDQPFGGGQPGVDFDAADPNTTGQVMKFIVTATKTKGRFQDTTTPPDQLVLPAINPLGDEDNFRIVTLNELESSTVNVVEDSNGNIVLDCNDGEPFGPIQALLGILDDMGNPVPLHWNDNITEDPVLGQTELWEIQNYTMDAHPIHVHLVMFQVIEREDAAGNVYPPEPWESGWKDTVIAYPDQKTRIKARFDLVGLYVWHCHIIDHEDNEMMRPYRVCEP